MNNYQPFTDVKELITWIEHQKRFSKKVSLDKMQYYCNLLNNPQRKFKSIHVTGTNGKGSTVAYLNSILMKAGANVGTFTSPYITCFNERISYNNIPISDDDLLLYSNIIIDKYFQIMADDVELPTFFEFTTLVCFLYFASLDVLDFAIIEVGIGGRLDSTNVLTPLISVITNVDYDHMNVLGDTLELITEQKLGIVKNAVPLVTGVQLPNLIDLMINYCNSYDAPFYRTLPSAIEIKKMGINGSQIIINGQELTIALAGFHQIENALVALKVIEVGEKIGCWKSDRVNLNFTNVILNEGLRKVQWYGRLEILSNLPLVIADGAHNPDGIRRVCQFIKTLDYRYKRCVIAISNDKEKQSMLEMIAKTFDEVVCTEYQYLRTAKAIEIYDLLKHENKLVIEDLKDTKNYVINHPVDFTIYIGSLYLVSDIRKLYPK